MKDDDNMKISMIKPILVTGSHRSGSTWVGKMIAQSSDVGYIHEPFSLLHRPGLCNNEFNYWFTYISEDNESQYIENFLKCFQFKYEFLLDLKNFISCKDIYYSIKDFLRFTYYRINNCRPLIKDPIALFSAEWLGKHYNMDVIVMIRHPAAFAGSLKKVHWVHPFDHFLKQSLLVEKNLREFKNSIEEFTKKPPGIIDQAILLWNLIHFMILKFKRNNPSWLFVRHEDISRDPITEFTKIFHYLNLDFSRHIEKKIYETSFSKNKEVIKRDSKANIYSWKNRLTDSEVEQVKVGTQTIANQFYTEEDWA